LKIAKKEGDVFEDLMSEKNEKEKKWI